MSSAKESRRHCPYLFVLGNGFQPGAEVDAYLLQFAEASKQLDCSKSEVIHGQAQTWDEDARASVGRSVRKWLKTKNIAFDDRRLVVRTFGTESGPIAIAGYVPKSRSRQPVVKEPPAESPSSVTDDTLLLADSSPGTGQVEEAQPETHETAGPSPIDRLKAIPPKFIAIGGGGVAALVLLAILIPMLTGDTESETDEKDPVETASTDTDKPSNDPKVLPPPSFETGTLRIYTETPGFSVLVDGNVVVDEEGNPVTTPCAVTAEVGQHNVQVFQEGFLDTGDEVNFTEDAEVTLRPLEDAAGSGSDALRAPWRTAEVGNPIPLEAVNSTRSEFDPYLTKDGLSLWFAGDRQNGRGVFVSTRLSPFHDFGEPQAISRSADVPGTPSVTDDALLVAYTVPEKARLFSLSRSNPLGEFEKKPIRAAEGLAPTWASAQILGDGLRIYWLEITSEKTRTLMSTRTSRDAPFANLYEFSMPGKHPCLSQDGLRQFVFDGSRLLRYRRTAVTKVFGSPEVIAKLDLPEFVPSDAHRQIFVSDDEQWMFYCDDPVSGGDLFAVRLSEGPGWGVRPTGKSIPPKPVVVAKVDPDPDMKPAEIPEKPVEKPVDPRSLPLPYTAHRKVFETLIANRQYDELAGLIQNAKSNPAMQPFSALLGWDEEELKHVQRFWTDAEKGVGELKAGESIRIANNRAEFVEFKDGTIHATRAGNAIRRTLDELRASELTQFYDRLESSGDAEGDFRAAIFLTLDRDGVPRSAETRMKRTGRLGETFRERLVRRFLAQAKGELDRSKFGDGTRFLSEAQKVAAGLPIESEVQKLQDSLYEYIKWRKVGPRGWAIRGNEYEAVLERQRGSMLLSEIQYKNVEVSLEWKTVDSTIAQGGVFFRYSGQGDPNENGYKVQLANDFGVAPDNFSTGALFREDRADVNAVKPAGEWNTLHLKVLGPDVTITINGKVVLETVANSEGKPESGYVGLDGVAGGITYRKILVSELPE